MRAIFSRGFFADIIFALIAIIIAINIPFDSHDVNIKPEIELFKITTYLSLFIISSIIAKTNQSVWRWTTLDNIFDILKSVISASLLNLLIHFLLAINTKTEFYPSETFIAMGLMLSFILATRGFARILAGGGNITALKALFRPVEKDAPAAIIVGTTDSVSQSIHEIRKLGPLPFRPIAIVSTFGNHINKVFAGARVYDGSEPEKILMRLVKSAQKKYKDVRIIMVGDVHIGDVSQAAMNVMAKTNAKIARMPEIGSKSLGAVNPADVLGRKRHKLNNNLPQKLINQKIVLITGAGGTIGSELVKQIATFNPGKLILVDSSENNLYSINQVISEEFPALNLVSRLLDIRDKYQVDELFNKYKPQIILHAAANKHVPILESHPMVAINVNLGGTKNLADAALQNNSEVFVLISTDKAVNPSNMMGAAKRAAELYIRKCFDVKKSGFYSVRFGNVLGSSGSVMPLFERQISQMGPLTITHRNMTRWFMTVDEAAGLVIQAAALGANNSKEKLEQNEPLIVLDMGEPIRIIDFAETLIRLKGYEPNRDIEIIEVGIRPGEKLHEELFYESEHVSSSDIDGILYAKPSAALPSNTNELINKILSYAAENNIKEAVKTLQELVPEFKPKPNEYY